MKKISFLLLTVAIAFSSFAQTTTEETDLVQAAFGMEKKAVVASFVKPSDVQKDAFWSLYDEYEMARKENGKNRIALLERYAKEYNTLTDEQAEEWTAQVIKLSAKTDKLIASYYKKIKKVTSPIVATQFYQIENYFLVGIRMQILDNIPFVGELK